MRSTGGNAGRVLTGPTARDRPWTRVAQRDGQPLNATYRSGSDLLRVLGGGEDHRIHLVVPCADGRLPVGVDGRQWDRRWLAWVDDEVNLARSLADSVLAEWRATDPVAVARPWATSACCGADWSVMVTRAEEVALAAHLRSAGRPELLHCDLCAHTRPRLRHH